MGLPSGMLASFILRLFWQPARFRLLKFFRGFAERNRLAGPLSAPGSAPRSRIGAIRASTGRIDSGFWHGPDPDCLKVQPTRGICLGWNKFAKFTIQSTSNHIWITLSIKKPRIIFFPCAEEVDN